MMPTEKKLTPSQKRRIAKQREYCIKWRKAHPEYSREALINNLPSAEDIKD